MDLRERRHTVGAYDEVNESWESELDFELFMSEVVPPFELVQKQGWGKISKCYFTNYKPAFLVLSSTSLKLLAKEPPAKTIFVINFDLYTPQLTPISETEVKISAFSCKNSIKLKFLPTEIAQWTFALTSMFLEAFKKHGKILRLNGSEKFWKNESISEQRFLNTAQSGDLLLFRGKNWGCKVQRCLTRSKFDHVGLVVKFKSGEIGFLEASRAFGVVFTYWDKLFKKDWKSLYSEIWYKRLEVQRSLEMISGLQRFICESKGKAYSLKIGKNKKNVSPGCEETFFCSELIASAYKVIGVLPSDVPSYKFYPWHFEGSDKFETVKGVLLEEQHIDIN